MMGMGEPLLNFDNVVPALRLMLDDNAYGLSRRRVTLSTSGRGAGIDRLRDDCPVALADLAARAERRAARPAGAAQPQIPAARAARRLPALPRGRAARLRHLRVRDARRRQRQRRSRRASWSAISRRVRCKFNLIPFNPFPTRSSARSDPSASARFAEILAHAGVTSPRARRAATISTPPAASSPAMCRPHATRSERTHGARRRCGRESRLLALAALALLAGLRCSQPSADGPTVADRPGGRRDRAIRATARGVHTELAGLYYSRGNMNVALEELRIAAPPTRTTRWPTACSAWSTWS